MGVPEGVELRTATAGDHPGVRRVVAAAFAHHPAVADLVEDIRASAHHRPDLEVVAVEAADGREQVVGHVLVSGATLEEADGTRHGVLTLSPLAVDPDRQRRGIGSALVREVLARCERTDDALVTLEGSPAYYPRFGFRPAGEVGVTLSLPDWAPPEAAMVYVLPGYRPEVRGHVRYPPAFDGV